MRSYLQPEEVLEKLKSIQLDLTESVYEAVKEVNKIRSQGNTIYRKSCIADMLHDHISTQVKVRLECNNLDGLIVNTTNQLFHIKLKDFALITLHKLDKKTLRPPKPDTGQSLIFEKQGDCFNHREKLTNLYFGFTLDTTSTEVTGIYILLSVDGVTEWVLDLLNNTSEGLGNIDFPMNPEPVIAPVKRTKVKEGIKIPKNGENQLEG
ncbi:hypothetical protein [Adhaeribacter rhizoryzae]|nr:hypothetical protein [Adhaeribacter rhizoryzae]